MSAARDAGPGIADLSLEDQARACHDEITAFMAARVAQPLLYDLQSVYNQTSAALVEAEQIMCRAAMLLGGVIGRG